jgi:hypothetical protein
MLTLTGSTGATFVITNGLKQAFGFEPRWLGLLVAELLCIAATYYGGKTGSDYVIAIINGFLVFCSAAGVTGVGNATVNRDTQPASARDGNIVARGDVVGRPPAQKRSFFSPWF